MPRLTVKELRKAVDIELETVWYRLIDRIATLADRQADMAMRYDRMVDQIQQLTQLAKEQAETITNLTRRLEELAEAHNTVAVEMVRAHRRHDHLNYETFTLSESTARRVELHGNWITELFNRLNDHMNEE